MTGKPCSRDIRRYPEVWGGRATLLVRLPLQFLLIAIILYAMKTDDRKPAAEYTSEGRRSQMT